MLTVPFSRREEAQFREVQRQESRQFKFAIRLQKFYAIFKNILWYQ